MHHRQMLLLWVVKILDAASELMRVWGWDSGHPDYKIKQEYTKKFINKFEIDNISSSATSVPEGASNVPVNAEAVDPKETSDLDHDVYKEKVKRWKLPKDHPYALPTAEELQEKKPIGGSKSLGDYLNDIPKDSTSFALMVEPDEKNLRNDAIRLFSLRGSAFQAIGEYVGARDEYDKVLKLCSIKNYTQYRKIVIEKAKCHISQGEFTDAREIIVLLILKDLPPDVYDSLDIVKIFRGSRELGFLLMLCDEGIRQIKRSGFSSSLQRRAFEIKSNGVLEKSPQKSPELAPVPLSHFHIQHRKVALEEKALAAQTELDNSRHEILGVVRAALDHAKKSLIESQQLLESVRKN